MTSSVPSRFRALRTAFVLVVAAFALAPAPSGGPIVLARETAGPGGESVGLVMTGGKIAGAVLWPAATIVEGRALPAGTMAVAAHATLTAALAGEPGARPLLESTAGFLALGVEVPDGDEARLIAILARLASPAAPSPAAVATAVQTLRKRVTDRWADPLERARLAAIGLLFPGAGGPWLPWGTPDSLARVDAPAVQAAVAAVRRRPVGVRVVGPAGLAGRAATALSARVGRMQDTPAPPEAPALPVAAVLPAGPEDPPVRDVGMALAYRVPPGEDAAGPALAVLVEALSEGPGSLPQRLRVALSDPVRSVVEVVPTPGGGGVLVVGARVAHENGAAVYRVLDGVISSVRALPMSDASITRARRRLDDQASYRAGDAVAALLGLIRRTPWSWPPEGSRPESSAVRQAATGLFDPERRATAAAGKIPAEILSADPLRAGVRIAWRNFDPLSEGLGATAEAPDGAAAAPAAAGARLAREIFERLAGGLSAGALPAFRASYQSREATPVGPATSALSLEASAEGTTVASASRHWTIRARIGEEGAEAQLPGSQGTAPLAEADRIAAIALREPLLLASAAAKGAVPSTVLTATCDELPCRALRVELGEGTVLLLALDPASSLPTETRIWFAGRDESKPPDEHVRYTSWTTVGGARLASGMTIRDGMGTTRELRLVEWSWLAPGL